MFMKTFEEKWTAWVDDQLTGRELSEFLASLPDRAAAEAEKQNAKQVGSLLRDQAMALSNADFFSHQLRERLDRENVPEQTVWSGLIIATNSPPTEPTPAEVTQIEGTLRKLFGYSQFQLIGEARKTLKTGEEDWLATSKYFSLHVDSRGEKADAYVLNLKLFQEQKLLLETKARLSKASPLVIRGPQVGDGQLVIVLVVQ